MNFKKKLQSALNKERNRRNPDLEIVNNLIVKNEMLDLLERLESNAQENCFSSKFLLDDGNWFELSLIRNDYDQFREHAMPFIELAYERRLYNNVQRLKQKAYRREKQKKNRERNKKSSPVSGAIGDNISSIGGPAEFISGFLG